MFKYKKLYPLRWFFIWALIMAACMVYANLTGWRAFSFGSTQQWSASGPGYHK
jgi:hypothetical protein